MSSFNSRDQARHPTMDGREANTIIRSPTRSGDEMMGGQPPQMMILMGQKQELDFSSKPTPWHVMPVAPNPSTPPCGFDHRRSSWVDEHGPTSCASAAATAVPQPAPIAAHAPPPSPPPSAASSGVTGVAPAPGHAAAAGWPPGLTEQARDGSGDTDSYQRHQHHQHHHQQQQQQQPNDQHRPLQMVPLSAHEERHAPSSRAYSQQHPSQQPYQQPQYLLQQQQPQHHQQHYSPALHHHQSMPNFRTSPMHPGSPASSTGGGTPRARPGTMADRGASSSHSSHVYRPYNPLEHLPPHAPQPRMNNSNFEGAHLASAIGSDDRFSTVGPARVATVSASMQQPSSGASSRPDEPTIQTLPIQQSAILSASRNSSMQQLDIHGMYQHSYPHSNPQHQQHDTSAVGFSHHVPPTLAMSARSGESPTSRQQQFYPAAAQQVHYARPSSSSSSSVTSSWSTLSPILDRPYQPNAIASGPTTVYSPRPSVNPHWGPSSANEFANAGGVFSAAPRYSTYEEGIMAQNGAQYLPIASGMPVPLLSSPPLPLRPRHSPPSERSTGSDEERKESTTPFISKLSHLLSNEDYRHLIRWNDEGDKFTFAHSSPELLEAFTRIFRHGNIHSFVRQLNIYSFTRLSTMELVECLPSNEDPARVSDYHGFMHPLFFRDSPHRTCDLTKIKPKASKKSAASKGNGNAMFPNAPPTPGDKRRSSLSGLSSSVREAASPYAFHPHPPQLQDELYHRY